MYCFIVNSPPSLFPGNLWFVVFYSYSFAFSRISGKSNHISVAFWFWLLFHSANDFALHPCYCKSSFLFIVEYYFMVWKNYSLSVPQLKNIWDVSSFRQFDSWQCKHSETGFMGAKVLVLLGWRPRRWTALSYDWCMFNFQGIVKLFSRAVVFQSILYPHQQCVRVQLSCILASTWWEFLCCLDSSTLADRWFANIFFPPEACCFILFLQGIFLTQGSNPSLLCLLHWQVDFYHLCHLGNPFEEPKFLILMKTNLSLLKFSESCFWYHI